METVDYQTPGRVVPFDPNPAPAVDAETPRLKARVAQLEDALLRQGLRLAEMTASLLDARDERTTAKATAFAASARAVAAETRRDVAEAEAIALTEADRAQAADLAVLERELARFSRFDEDLRDLEAESVKGNTRGVKFAIERLLKVRDGR